MLLMLLACLTTPAEYRSLLLDAQDGDDDGQTASLYEGQDCDDSDPLVGAGFEEICDGLDNDCDGVVDEGVPDAPTWFLDADSDGFGDDLETLGACSEPEGYTDQGGDCDDSRPEVSPGREEVCGNGLDDDCDGSAGECWGVGAENPLLLAVDDSLLAWGESLGALTLLNEKRYAFVYPHTGMSADFENEREFSSPVRIGADGVLAWSMDNSVCIRESDGENGHKTGDDWDCPGGVHPGAVQVVEEVVCIESGEVACFLADASEPVPISADAALAGVGHFDGRRSHLALAEGVAVGIYTDAAIIGQTGPTTTLTLPSTPDSLCLLDGAIAWTTETGTFLMRDEEMVQLSDTGGHLQCSVFGPGLVLQVPPSEDTLVIHSADALEVSVEPITVELDAPIEELRHRAAISHDDTQAWLNWVAADTLWRMELGPGL